MRETRSELVTAFERGLAVLQSFSQASRPMTLTEVARANGLNVATARRAVLTLEKMGYLGRNERRFVLRPRVVALSAGYLTAVRRPFQPFLEEIVGEANGSAAFSVLDHGYVICLAHASTGRSTDVRRGAGGRCRVHATAAGQVLLSLQPMHVIHAYLSHGLFRRSMLRTQTPVAMWRTILERVREDGYAFVRDELDDQSLSLAIPVSAPDGTVVATLEWSGRTGSDEGSVPRQYLPLLQRVGHGIETMLSEVPDLVASLTAAAS